MPPRETKKTWRHALADFQGPETFGPQFFERYGAREWTLTEGDKSVARILHIELISRIATQRLGYEDGVEGRALKSLHELFTRARVVSEEYGDADTSEALVWHVLNTRMRPFLAKWHPKSEAGVLAALDTSDEFREELEKLRRVLTSLDEALRLVSDSSGYELAEETDPAALAIEAEFGRSVVWRPGGIVLPADGGGGDDSHRIRAEEEEGVVARRRHYGLPERSWAAGIALSGGGIRSATFSIGVLAALARRNLLPKFDYLSTVSGGGYAGAFLTQLLGTKEGDQLGLGREEIPFRRVEGESSILRTLRQRARYLAGGVWERVFVAMRQSYGLFLNVALILIATATFAYADAAVRRVLCGPLPMILVVGAPLAAVLLFATLSREFDITSNNPGRWHVLLGILFLVPPLWFLLGLIHTAWAAIVEAIPGGGEAGFSVAGLAAVASAVAIVGATAAVFVRIRPAAAAACTGLILLLAETVMYEIFSRAGVGTGGIWLLMAVLPAVAIYNFLDCNLTSLHGYYRVKLSAAFLLAPDGSSATPLKFADIMREKPLFPIINCALNVPNSKAPAMRGRLADVFALTPVSTGCTLLGHRPTEDWVAANPGLDLATAMALSGAAVSPQMGLRTTRLGSFWLTLLNIRLGLWLRKPGSVEKQPLIWRPQPNLSYLAKELTAGADETLEFVNVSDGGHIENLGVYELLRRRCRFIVAIDGENDPAMTFHALTNLQRLAYIDFGIRIDADLDDLRLGEKGLSRSHFRFCRVRYPSSTHDDDWEIGYLVYLKLSLTGNEGELIRRYKFDEPAFPHQSTANQFFSEPQFEAYRSLGEHAGDKLFLPALVGDIGRLDHIDLEAWMKALGCSLLDPYRP